MVDQRGFDNQPWVDAGAAAALLGVQRRTLYAYVSRGLVRSAPGTTGKARRYDRGDLERLVARHRARTGHGPVAAGALRWGEPVLESSITAIGPRGPSYRGHDAVDLAARGIGLERTAELLWTGGLPDAAAWPRRALPWAGLAKLGPEVAPGAALPLAVVALGLRDPGRHDPRPDAVLARARAAIPALAAATSLRHADAAMEAATVAGVLGRALLGKAPPRDAIAALDVALVLMADHELNASTFAARVVASTGAELYAKASPHQRHRCCRCRRDRGRHPLHGHGVRRRSDARRADRRPHGIGACDQPRAAAVRWPPARARARPHPSRLQARERDRREGSVRPRVSSDRRSRDRGVLRDGRRRSTEQATSAWSRWPTCSARRTTWRPSTRWVRASITGSICSRSA